VARKIITGGKVTFSGVTVNERTRAMLVAVDGLVAWSLTS
jgi:hypothetical protein